jgi:hypothetical protein
MCFWWCAEEPPETCRASVETSKFKKSCFLLAVICNYITMHGHIDIKNGDLQSTVLYTWPTWRRYSIWCRITESAGRDRIKLKKKLSCQPYSWHELEFDDKDRSIESYMTWGIPYILHPYSEHIYATLNLDYIKLMTSLVCLDSPQHACYM